MDNIAAKSEGGMKPDEVRDREQRKQAWQALSDTAVAAWKAMFSRSKRQRAERDPYPASMYDAFMVRRSAVLHRVKASLAVYAILSLCMQSTSLNIYQTWCGHRIVMSLWPFCRQTYMTVTCQKHLRSWKVGTPFHATWCF